MKQLLDRERFNLVDQMRRAGRSVTNCIAEGHGSRGWKHNISYVCRARGSMCELLDDLNFCEDERCFEKAHLDDLRKDADSVIKRLNGYIRYLKSRNDDAAE